MKIKYIRLGLAGIFSFVGFKAVNLFYSGWRNLDMAFNFLNLGYVADFSMSKTDISLREAYLNGLNQMVCGFGWVCFLVIIAIILGFFLNKEIK